MFYLLVRRWVPGRGVMKGLVFGLLLLFVGGSAVFDGDYEYFRMMIAWQAVAMFAALYPLFGVVLGFLTERWARRPQGAPGNGVVAVAGWAVLAIVVVRGALDGYTNLRDVPPLPVVTSGVTIVFLNGLTEDIRAPVAPANERRRMTVSYNIA